MLGAGSTCTVMRFRNSASAGALSESLAMVMVPQFFQASIGEFAADGQAGQLVHAREKCQGVIGEAGNVADVQSETCEPRQLEQALRAGIGDRKTAQVELAQILENHDVFQIGVDQGCGAATQTAHVERRELGERLQML